MRFSVVVPAYNEAATLPAALDSLCRQDLGEPTSRSSWWTTAATTTPRRSPARTARGWWTNRAAGSVMPGRPGSTPPAASSWSPPMPTPPIRPTGSVGSTPVCGRGPDAVAIAGPCRYADPPWWGQGVPADRLRAGGRDGPRPRPSLAPHGDQRGVPARGIPRLRHPPHPGRRRGRSAAPAGGMGTGALGRGTTRSSPRLDGSGEACCTPSSSRTATTTRSRRW